MLHQISYATIYTYSDPVILQPHLIRLRPRSDSWQLLKMFSLQVLAISIAQSEFTVLDGNILIKVWVASEVTSTLNVQGTSQILTHQANPFHYFLEAWATSF